MIEEKYIPMMTWVCVCGKEYRWEIAQITHSPFGASECLACNVKDGDRLLIKNCTCKKGLTKS